MAWTPEQRQRLHAILDMQDEALRLLREGRRAAAESGDATTASDEAVGDGIDAMRLLIATHKRNSEWNQRALAAIKVQGALSDAAIDKTLEANHLLSNLLNELDA